MTHIQTELLQQYLAGEVDLAAAEEIENHLSRCPGCQAVFETLAAEDAVLNDALVLNEAESAWITGVDLTPTVLRGITPWYLLPQGYFPILLMLGVAGWVMPQVWAEVTRLAPVSGPVGVAMGVLRRLIPLIPDLVKFLVTGGVLPVLLPAAGTVMIMYLITMRRRTVNE